MSSSGRRLRTRPITVFFAYEGRSDKYVAHAILLPDLRKIINDCLKRVKKSIKPRFLKSIVQEDLIDFKDQDYQGADEALQKALIRTGENIILLFVDNDKYEKQKFQTKLKKYKGDTFYCVVSTPQCIEGALLSCKNPKKYKDKSFPNAAKAKTLFKTEFGRSLDDMTEQTLAKSLSFLRTPQNSVHECDIVSPYFKVLKEIDEHITKQGELLISKYS